jgi:hypothetical protein
MAYCREQIYKGWMQTWLVHVRAPIRLMRELRLAGFLTLQLVVGGTVLAALVHPLFLALFAVQFATANISIGEGIAEFLLSFLYSSVFIGGYLTSVVLGLVGLARRRLLSSAWVLLLVPIHWLLLSIAAWQAVWKLAYDPYRWDKTEHGLARTSRKVEQVDKSQQPAQERIGPGGIRNIISGNRGRLTGVGPPRRTGRPIPKQAGPVGYIEDPA